MTSCILISRSSSVAADTASFTKETRASRGRELQVKHKARAQKESHTRSQASCADTTICSHAPTPFLTHSFHGNKQKHLLCLLGQPAFFSESYTHLLAAFIMTGCVKCNAMTSEVQKLHHFILTKSKKFFFFLCKMFFASGKSKTEQYNSKGPWCVFRTLNKCLQRISHRAGR